MFTLFVHLFPFPIFFFIHRQVLRNDRKLGSYSEFENGGGFLKVLQSFLNPLRDNVIFAEPVYNGWLVVNHLICRPPALQISKISKRYTGSLEKVCSKRSRIL